MSEKRFLNSGRSARTKQVAVFATLGVLAACGLNQAGNVSSIKELPASESIAKRPYDEAQVEACGTGEITLLGDAAFTRRPYLQKVTDTSASVLFTSEASGTFELSVSTPGGDPIQSLVAALDASVPKRPHDQYEVKVGELAPNTMYCYEITSGGEVVLESTGFRTAPAADSTAPVRFIALGDLGKATDDQYAVASSTEEVPYDFAVLTGDIAYDDGKLSEFERNYFAVYQDILRVVSWFPASGNHDYNTADASAFREVFALFENGGEAGRERWYSMDWGPIHFAFIDTEVMNSAQLEWLDKDLGATDRPWKIVVGHRPPYSSGSHGSDNAVRATIEPTLVRHNIPLALWGHEHNYERTSPQSGVVHIVTGGGGRGTRDVGRSSFTEYAESVGHFVHITVDGDILTLNAIDATGVDFDTVTIQRPR